MRIGVTSAEGSPDDLATWSGTPLAIGTALRSSGASVIPFYSGPRSRPGRIAIGLSQLGLGWRADLLRGPLSRGLAARRVEVAMSRHGAKDVLHTGTFDLPAVENSTLRHYLYVDSTWHLWVTSVSSRSELSQRVVRRAESLESESYAGLAHIFAISRETREDLIAHYGVSPERVSVVGTGVRMEPYVGPRSYDSGIVLFVASRRLEDKGIQSLVEGFKLARRSRPRYRLVVAGDRRLADWVSGVEGAEYAGAVSDEELTQLFISASLFAMPAKNEPWGLVFLESLLFRTPVLALDRSGVRDITADGRYGFLMSDGSPETVAKGLVAALENPHRLEQMGKLGQQHVHKNFSWDRVGEAILQVIGNNASE